MIDATKSCQNENKEAFDINCAKSIVVSNFYVILTFGLMPQ